MRAILCTLLMIPALAFGQASKAVPNLLPYQGRLLRTDRTPETGQVMLTFTIYSDAGQAGAVLWQEQQSVVLTNGFYAVMLGAGGVGGSLPAAGDGKFFLDGRDLWLGVKVQGDTAELSPRHRLASVAYAVTATNALNAATATHAASADSATTAANGLPPGTVIAFAGGNLPTGFLWCDGAEKNRTDYPALFAAIGGTWGGDGATTFKVPDLMGRTVVGAGAGGGLTTRTVGDYFGAEKHTLTVNEMPGHVHTGTTGATGMSQSNPWCTDYRNNGSYRGWSPFNGASCNANERFDQHVHSFTTDSSGGSAPHDIVQPSAALNYIIKT